MKMLNVTALFKRKFRSNDAMNKIFCTYPPTQQWHYLLDQKDTLRCHRQFRENIRDYLSGSNWPKKGKR